MKTEALDKAITESPRGYCIQHCTWDEVKELQKRGYKITRVRIETSQDAPLMAARWPYYKISGKGKNPLHEIGEIVYAPDVTYPATEESCPGVITTESNGKLQVSWDKPAQVNGEVISRLQRFYNPCVLVKAGRMALNEGNNAIATGRDRAERPNLRGNGINGRIYGFEAVGYAEATGRKVVIHNDADRWVEVDPAIAEKALRSTVSGTCSEVEVYISLRSVAHE